MIAARNVADSAHLMTSMAFSLGGLALVLSTGAGSGGRTGHFGAGVLAG